VKDDEKDCRKALSNKCKGFKNREPEEWSGQAPRQVNSQVSDSQAILSNSFD
jgi:hypothetical protein